MFRIDDDHVIDATMCGGLARYVNHCCNPNCIAEIVCLEKESKIIIIANKRVAKGEEVNIINQLEFNQVFRLFYLINFLFLSSLTTINLTLKMKAIKFHVYVVLQIVKNG